MKELTGVPARAGPINLQEYNTSSRGIRARPRCREALTAMVMHATSDQANQPHSSDHQVPWQLMGRSLTEDRLCGSPLQRMAEQEQEQQAANRAAAQQASALTDEQFTAALQARLPCRQGWVPVTLLSPWRAQAGMHGAVQCSCSCRRHLQSLTAPT